MYPPGHPSLGLAATNLASRIDTLLGQRGTLSLGVARDQIVIEGVATDAQNPVLSELARRLHQHHLGAISIEPGVTQAEIEAFLALVAIAADRSGEPLGLGPPERREQQPHIRLHPVAYDSLRLIVDDKGKLDEDEETREARTKFAQLWVGLARAAMAKGESDGSGEADGRGAKGAEGSPDEVNPVAVAHAIIEHPKSEAYDQVIVGYLLQIADELQTAAGPDAHMLNVRMRDMVSTLDKPTLARLLEMGGAAIQRRKFLMSASQGMSPDAVVQLIEAASESEENSASDYMLRMLQKLARHADESSGVRKQFADYALREQVTELITDWSLKDPNPDAYTTALQSIAGAAPLSLVPAEQASEAESKRIVEMALEVDVTGKAVWDAVKRVIDDNEGEWLMQRLQGNEGSTVASDVIGGSEQLTRLLQQVLEKEPPNPAVLDRLLPMVGIAAVEPLLDTLIASESKQTRRALVDRLIALGPQVVPAVVRHFDDERWYVKRNMLTILGGLTELPDDIGPDQLLRHQDPRVRFEALRIMFRLPSHREKAVGRALTDAEEKTVRLGLAAALAGCPKTAISLVISRATSTSGPADLRLTAIRVLDTIPDQVVTNALLSMVQPRRGLFHWKHPPKTPEYLAALGALQKRRDQRRVSEVFKLASRRRDPEIVKVTQGTVVDE